MRVSGSIRIWCMFVFVILLVFWLHGRFWEVLEGPAGCQCMWVVFIGGFGRSSLGFYMALLQYTYMFSFPCRSRRFLVGFWHLEWSAWIDLWIGRFFLNLVLVVLVDVLTFWFFFGSWAAFDVLSLIRLIIEIFLKKD